MTIQSEITFPECPVHGNVEVIECPCCGHVKRIYHRKFNSNMALAALVLYSLKTNEYVHLENTMISKGFKRCGDASYLTLYNIIQKKIGKREDMSPKNGMYRLTGFGILFCEGKTAVHEKFIFGDNRLIGFEGNMVTIKDVLKEKFNYDELMNQ